MPHEVLTMDQLAAGLAGLNGKSAPGMDGWRPGALGQLPKSLLLVPLAFLQISESAGRWPLQATAVSVTLLKKPGPLTALNTRRIRERPGGLAWSNGRARGAMKNNTACILDERRPMPRVTLPWPPP